jgi:hypothetical protein
LINLPKCKHFFVNHQGTKTGKETLLSKVNYEQFAVGNSCKVHHIHSDNGTFVQSCEAANQNHSFCGIGAHWRSVKCYIGYLTTKVHHAFTRRVDVAQMYHTQIVAIHHLSCCVRAQFHAMPCTIKMPPKIAYGQSNDFCATYTSEIKHGGPLRD